MARALSGLLWCLSQLYGAGVSLRHALYNRGWLRTVRIEAPVISVGNIVCGGSGKTPLVKLLAEKISKTNRVAILTRGYCSRAEKMPGGLRISSEDVFAPEICGDEP